MGFRLDEIVPWGRSLSEYQRMFRLTAADLECRILGCADGPASFNCELTARGGDIISCDPIYQYSAEEIRSRIAATSEKIVQQAWANQDSFVWSREIPNPDVLGEYRMQAMMRYLDDYEQGKEQGRYVVAELPTLPFARDTFELAVCSHFLFLYSEKLSCDFHIESILHLLEVASEVRVFPLLDLSGSISPHVDPVTDELRHRGFRLSITQVDYEVQRDGNRMLTVTRPKEAGQTP